jgi:N-acetylmuramoyl-L-alanine amidase
MIEVAVICVAMAVWHEARNEPDAGQYAVAHVVLNRAKEKGISPCRVIAEPAQFTNIAESIARNPKGPQWNAALIVAARALEGDSWDVTHGCEYFHADYVNPKWRKKMQFVVQIGRHLFYRSVKPVLIEDRNRGNVLVLTSKEKQ